MIGGTIYRPLSDLDSGYKVLDNGQSIIKWLRQHGERGRDWEFAGSGRSLNLWFMNAKLETLYILRWE